jgi:hypothetical protein
MHLATAHNRPLVFVAVFDCSAEVSNAGRYTSSHLYAFTSSTIILPVVLHRFCSMELSHLEGKWHVRKTISKVTLALIYACEVIYSANSTDED